MTDRRTWLRRVLGRAGTNTPVVLTAERCNHIVDGHPSLLTIERRSAPFGPRPGSSAWSSPKTNRGATAREGQVTVTVPEAMEIGESELRRVLEAA